MASSNSNAVEATAEERRRTTATAPISIDLYSIGTDSPEPDSENREAMARGEVMKDISC